MFSTLFEYIQIICIFVRLKSIIREYEIHEPITNKTKETYYGNNPN